MPYTPKGHNAWCRILRWSRGINSLKNLNLNSKFTIEVYTRYHPQYCDPYHMV